MLFIFRAFQDMANKRSFTILLIFWLVAAATSFDDDNVQLRKKFQANFKRVLNFSFIVDAPQFGLEKGGGWEGGGVGRWNKKSNWGGIRCPVLVAISGVEIPFSTRAVQALTALPPVC